MALPATLVWEIRPTNGTANAGGGFDPSVASPGTDFSQQNAVQVAYTDLVIGASNTLTSAAVPFTASDVGNNITITSGTGFTAGIYNIRSHAAGVVTLDRSPGTLDSTGGVGNLGGAIRGMNQGTTKVQASVVAGNKIWIKNEAWNEAITMSVAGAAGNPIVWEGYNATRGDAPTGSNRPRNNRASAAGNAISGSVAENIFKNIWVSNCGSTGGWANSYFSTFINCRSSNNTGYGFNIAGLKINCEADNNSVDGFNAVSSTQRGLFGCYAHDNSAIGFDLVAVNESMAFCISEANASHGLSISGGSVSFHINNTINGNTGASTDGVNSSGAPTAANMLYNNIISNNGRYGANYTDGDSVSTDFNNFYGNGTAARNNFPTGANDLALDPGFTNAAGGDFSIGTNLKALGFPGVFPSGTSTGYLDIGAVQRQEPIGGSGAFYKPTMRTA